MRVSDLIEALSSYPPDLEIVVVDSDGEINDPALLRGFVRQSLDGEYWFDCTHDLPTGARTGVPALAISVEQGSYGGPQSD